MIVCREGELVKTFLRVGRSVAFQQPGAAASGHLLDRVHSRQISPEQLGELAQWLDTAPEVRTGR